MTTTIVVSIFLALFILVILVYLLRQSSVVPVQQEDVEQAQVATSQMETPLPEPAAIVDWAEVWKTEALALDKAAYKTIDQSSCDLLMPAAARIRAASKQAAINAYRAAIEANVTAEVAKTAAIDAYRATSEAMLSNEQWRLAWQKNSWDVDGDAYRAVADLLDDEDGYLTVCSLSAISRVVTASKDAAIVAYRQACENEQGCETSRKIALDAYRTTFATQLAAAQAEQADVSDVHKRLHALSPTQIKQIEQSMYPNPERGMQDGVSSVSGFLQEGERLLEVIAHDEQTLRKLGITPAQVADGLELYVALADRMRKLAARGQLDVDPQVAREMARGHHEIVIDRQFAVTFQSYLGSQACPFEDAAGQICGSRFYGDRDFTIKNLQINEAIDFPGLIIHLIREHHFFEGAVPYRVDPRRVIRVLELQPGVDYHPRYKRTAVWHRNQGTWTTGEAAFKSFAFLKAIRDNPITMVTLDETTHLYVRGDDCLSMAEHAYQVPPDFMVDGATWSRNTIQPGLWGYERSDELLIEP